MSVNADYIRKKKKTFKSFVPTLMKLFMEYLTIWIGSIHFTFLRKILMETHIIKCKLPENPKAYSWLFSEMKYQDIKINTNL